MNEYEVHYKTEDGTKNKTDAYGKSEYDVIKNVIEECKSLFKLNVNVTKVISKKGNKNYKYNFIENSNEVLN